MHATGYKNPSSIHNSNFQKFKNERYIQLEEIYDAHIDRTHSTHWITYTEHFDDVAAVIQNLNLRKDAGPMGITATFIKFNASKLPPIIHHYLSKILEFGIIPDE